MRAGKGFAIVKGFEEAIKAKSRLIGFVDADMATPPRAFYGLVRNIKGYDGIIANRWDNRSIIITKQTLLRRIMSRSYNFLVRSMFFIPHRDTQCGAKLFKKELLEKIIPKLGSSEWSFDIDGRTSGNLADDNAFLALLLKLFLYFRNHVQILY